MLPDSGDRPRLQHSPEHREKSALNPFLKFLSENKAWWITPIVIVLGLVAWLILSEGSQASGPSNADPFIYDAN